MYFVKVRDCHLLPSISGRGLFNIDLASAQINATVTQPVTRLAYH